MRFKQQTLWNLIIAPVAKRGSGPQQSPHIHRNAYDETACPTLLNLPNIEAGVIDVTATTPKRSSRLSFVQNLLQVLNLKPSGLTTSFGPDYGAQGGMEDVPGIRRL